MSRMISIPLTPLIDLDTTVTMLKSAAPDWEWMLKHIESKHGELRFPTELTDFIKRFNIANYPLFYQSEDSIAYAAMKGVLSDDGEIKQLCDDMNAATPGERGEVLRSINDGVEQALGEVEAYNCSLSKAELEAKYLSLNPQEKADACRSIQWLGISFLSMFHQVLSVMIHREKLTALVAKAKAGDDIAFVKAVQIDKRILTVDPYFESRFHSINTEGNENFRDKLAYRLRCAPYAGKVRHKSLWMSLAFLDMCGHLDTLKRREMLDVLDEAGVGGHENRIVEVKYLDKRIGEYKALQQGILRLSTPRNSF